MTIEGFAVRLVIGVLLLVFYNLFTAKAALKPDQENVIGWVVLLIVALFVAFGGFFFPGTVLH